VFLGSHQRCGWIARIQRPEFLQWRQRDVTIAETLHATAFLVHAQQLRSRRGGADRCAQFTDLFARSKVPCEQNHPADSRMLQPFAFVRVEFGRCNADYQHQSIPFNRLSS